MKNKKYLNIFILVGILAAFWWSGQAAAKNSAITTLAVTDSGPLIGLPFTISKGAIDEVSPAVAYNPLDREYMVVWQNVRSVTDDIYAQRISEQGVQLSSFTVAQGESPNVAYNPKNNTYLVVYGKWVNTDYDIYAQRVDFKGKIGNEFAIAFDLNHTEHSPAVAYNTHPNHDEFLVVWEEIPPPPMITNRVEGMRVKGTEDTGSPIQTIGSPISITDPGNYFYEPDVAYNLNMNEYMVVYTRLPGGGGNYDVYNRRITWDGIKLAEEAIDSSANDQANPAVAAYRLNHNTPYLVVFTDYMNDTAGDVRGYLAGKDGKPVQLVNIAETSGQTELDPAIGQNESWGGYMVTWTQGPIKNHDIFGMKIGNNGLDWPEFDLSDGMGSKSCDRKESVIAVGFTSALAVWSDPCGSAGGFDIVGRMLGYQIYIPMVER